ncbi:hypothetical protein [Streptomyces turgidiscabies]|uniref:DNA repair exonuclease SbcCD nuclease subunit n=1 Tax=Streptomyces turgidiscabies TaxID=85558 RepID=A0ABU0RQN3_9ACTN|nr:hypothetical protein [Streptomyces turgidiscabies]MDQ0934294.1 DNA repair exonuclease SbcCD nuclease subunit [Streptomyces turgidiscabies]
MRILHLSDTHINHAGAPNRHGVDTIGSLRRNNRYVCGQGVLVVR